MHNILVTEAASRHKDSSEMESSVLAELTNLEVEGLRNVSGVLLTALLFMSTLILGGWVCRKSIEPRKPEQRNKSFKSGIIILPAASLYTKEGVIWRLSSLHLWLVWS